MKYLEAFEKLHHAKTESQIEECFQSIAHTLLNQTLLEVNGQDYRITEIEFYFKNEFFQDPFVHCDERQKLTNEWYFHRRGSGYKDGNYKGLDLTFGTQEAFGGILIRGIENFSSLEYFDGPSIVVDEILNNFGTFKVCEIAPDIEKHHASSSSGILKLKDLDTSIFQIPTKGPRVGLPFNKKDEDLRLKFLMKNYRFLSDPKKTSKHRHTLFLSMIDQGIAKEIAAEFIDLRKAEAEKYLFNYLRGMERHPLYYCEQKLSVLSHCEMIGSVHKAKSQSVK